MILVYVLSHCRDVASSPDADFSYREAVSDGFVTHPDDAVSAYQAYDFRSVLDDN
jgi:hypothetical protein